MSTEILARYSPTLGLYGNVWHILGKGQSVSPEKGSMCVIAGRVGAKAIEIYGLPETDHTRNAGPWRELSILVLSGETTEGWTVTGSNVEPFPGTKSEIGAARRLETLLAETEWDRTDTAAAAARIADFHMLVEKPLSLSPALEPVY